MPTKTTAELSSVCDSGIGWKSCSRYSFICFPFFSNKEAQDFISLCLLLDKEKNATIEMNIFCFSNVSIAVHHEDEKQRKKTIKQIDKIYQQYIEECNELRPQRKNEEKSFFGWWRNTFNQ